jgi:hypothetical protein
MGSLELRAKTKEELSEWRLAFEQATTPITSSFEEHVIETKKIYAQMSDVIQQHIDDDLQDTRHNAENIEDCRFGTALQVSQPLLFHFVYGLFSLLPALFLMRVQISIRSVQDFAPLLSKKSSRNEEFFVEVICGSQSLRTNCVKVGSACCLFALNLFVGQLDDSDASDPATERSSEIQFDDGGAPVVGFV